MKPRTILVVEDHDELRKNVCSLLKEDGHYVIPAQNGKIALTILGAFVVHFIVLDMMMPVMDGDEFLREKNQHPEWKRIPVCVLTEFKSAVRAAQNHLVDCVLVKPHDVLKLSEKAREFMLISD